MRSICNLVSDFYIRNQQFTVYYSGFCRLYCVVNRELVFVGDCKDLESAKERARIYMCE